MREIKFRGKRIDNGEWAYGYYVRYEHMGNVKHIIVTDLAQVHVNSYYVILETVGQYTGLKDKNGKEIYEGDVVKRTIYPLNQYSYDEYYQIKELNYYIYKGEKCGHFNVSLWSTDCEIISNIHDNPELLESEVN